AAIATIGQATGYLFSKQGMYFCDFITATQIRLTVAIAGFGIIVLLSNSLGKVLNALHSRYVMPRLLLASTSATFIGVILSMFALQTAKVGIASTIMSTVPILLIAPAVFIFKERITAYEIFGTIAAVAGVALFFL
ncbi:MAG TPA: EamA family transporter, partial [Syntrophales bacterium]|nr:EamA family transporter [Syntrophales bacterium]